MTLKTLCGALAALSLAAPAYAAGAPASSAPATPFDREVLAAKTSMMGEPKAAFVHAQAAATAALSLPDGPDRQIAKATAEWLEGEASIRMRKPAEAETLLASAADIAARLKPNSKLQGDIFRSQGRRDASVGRVQAALARYQDAYRIYQRANEKRSQAMALQDIGSIYSDARDYPHMLQYYKQSNEAFAGDPTLNLTGHNNRGIALKQLTKYAEAMVELQASLDAAKVIESRYLQSHIYSDLAFVAMLMKRPADAEGYAQKGLALGANDADAKGERPFLQVTRGWAVAERGDAARAAKLVDEAFAGVDLSKTPMDFRDFHEVAARIYDAAGQQRQALAQLKAFKRLDDQGRDLAASTNAALMAAQFDFANQDLKIAKLKAGELERDIKLANAQARIRTVIVTGVLILGGGAFAVTLLGFLSMRRSRNRIRAANDQLGVANGALERALQAKTEFLATTSHEIRTPLNGILGMTQVILADQSLTEGVRERLNLVQGAGETMKSLVDDLLDVAKVENGSVTIHPEPFDLQRALAQAEVFWSGQAQSKGIDLTLDMSEAPRRVVADEGRLRQVVFNLMSNALKFTDGGRVTLRAFAEDETLVISVEDTGIGIPEHEHQRIFEAFTQVDGSTSRKYGGTGLGLSICRNVSEAMGGCISVSSSEGHGATFVLRLPLVLAESCGRDSGAPSERLEDASVIIIDANPLSLSMLKAVVAPACQSVYAVNSVSAALEQLSASPADLIVVDATALTSDSTARLKALGEASSARVAVTWPRATPDGAPSPASQACDLVLLKPATAPEILEALKALLAKESDRFAEAA